MIPVEVTQAPWHATGFWDWLDHWQTLIAGVLAFAAGVGTVVAAIWAIWATRATAREQIAATGKDAQDIIAATRDQTDTTARLERERLANEVAALRTSLAVEFRLQIARAFDVYYALRKLSSTSDGPISARMVEGKSRMPAPIIYLANAGKLGLLEGDAMGVAIVYTTLEGARLRTDLLARTYDTPGDIDSDDVMETAKVFLAACGHAQGVLPRLRTGDGSYDDQDKALLQKIKAAVAASQA